MYRYRIEYLKDSAVRRQLAKEHKSICEALRTHDKERALRYVYVHIDNQQKAIIRSLNEEKDLALNQGEMLLLAIATSIDALAVGIMFAFTYDSLNIYWAIAIIGFTTFVLSIIGVIVGNFFGNKYKKKSEIAGGIILILIGVKILLEHLGIISF